MFVPACGASGLQPDEPHGLIDPGRFCVDAEDALVFFRVGAAGEEFQHSLAKDDFGVYFDLEACKINHDPRGVTHTASGFRFRFEQRRLGFGVDGAVLGRSASPKAG